LGKIEGEKRAGIVKLLGMRGQVSGKPREPPVEERGKKGRVSNNFW